jgi:iron(III) transport system permease protein
MGRRAGRLRLPADRGTVARWAPVALIGGAVLLPLARLAGRGLGEGLDGYRRLAEVSGIGSTILNTALLAFGSALIALAVGITLAVAASKCQGRFGAVLRVVPVLPLVMPIVAAVIGWTFLLSPRVGYLNQLLRTVPPFRGDTTGPIDVYTVPWIVIITGFSLASFVYLFVLSAVQEMGDDYDEAARVSGAGFAARLRRVTLPLLRPSIVYAGATVLLLGVGQFAAPLLLGRAQGVDVITTEIYKLTQSPPIDFGMGAALGMPFVVLGVGIIFLQRRVLRDQVRYRTHGSRRQGRRQSRGAAAVLVGYGLVAVALPLLALAQVALSPFWSGRLDLSNLTLENLRLVIFDNPRTRQAILTSLTCAGLAAAIVIPLGLAVAGIATAPGRKFKRAGAVLDLLCSLPLVVPASLFGFAFLFAYTEPPFRLYGTTTVIVIAYVTLMLPHAVRSQSASLLALQPEYWAAARACGASPARAAVRIILPLIRGGVASGVALVFVMLSHEFAASLMLRSARTQVMGTVLYEYWTSGTYPQVAAIALVMVAVTTVGVVLALVAGGSRSLTRLEAP